MPFTALGAGTALGNAGNYAGESAVRQMTPFERLNEAVSRIDVVASNIIDTASRIAGPIKGRDSEKSPSPSDVPNNCMLDAMEQLAFRLQRIASLLDDANSVVVGRL